jgi:hypothetical protein
MHISRFDFPGVADTTRSKKVGARACVMASAMETSSSIDSTGIAGVEKKYK